MTLGLASFYWGGALIPALLGLALFGALALLWPDLGLLFVPLTAPLYLIPAALAGIRADPATPFRVPLHEAALLAVGLAALARWLWRSVSRSRPLGDRFAAPVRSVAARSAPHVIFLLAGAVGVLLAVERSRALREFRWLIAEPLLFYGLTLWIMSNLRHTHRASEQAPTAAAAFQRRLIAAFVLGGALAGLLGLLQYAGLDLVPLLGRKQCFAPDGGPCANIVADGGVRRVLSVYGHPNNLGLYLGRVWPIAAAMALAPLLRVVQGRRRLFFVLCSLLCLGGIVVSFSRGAWLGAVAAAAVLAIGLTMSGEPKAAERLPLWSFILRPLSRWLIGLGVGLAVLAGLALSIRGDVTAGSTPARLLLWREAIGYLVRHPLGIGLDQFGYYHDPGSGLSLIDPLLIGNSDQYAAHPHNLLLDIWLRMGPPGLLAFGWLLVRFFRASLRRFPAPLAVGAAAAMTAALAHGLVDNFYFVSDLALAFWLLMALPETDDA
jgi:O-antigen ligase